MANRYYDASSATTFTRMKDNLINDGSVDLVDNWNIFSNNISLISGTLSASTITDGHATLTGGSFTTTVGGQTPTSGSHLATKSYVDGSVSASIFWDRVGTAIVPLNAGDSVEDISELKMTDVLTNTYVVGPPFVISSTDKVINLNVDQVDSYHFNQSLETGNSPSFIGLTVAGLPVAGGIVQTDGTGALSSSVTLPNGTLATTQGAGDNSTKVSTTAYADAAISLHHHDSRYHTETELNSVVNGSEGSTLIGYKDGETVKEILDDIINKGVLDAITITDAGTLDITWTAGEIYDHANGNIVDTDSGSGTCTDGSINYLKWVSGTTLTLSTTHASGDEIQIAHINCQANDIWAFHEQDVISHRGSDISEALGEIFEVIVTGGLLISEDTDVTNVWDVVLSAGVYYHEGHERHDIAAPVYSRVSNLIRWYHSGGVWASTANAEIDTTQWDNGTNLAGISAAKYYRSLFFIIDDGDIHWVYPTVEYNTLNSALMASDPSLPAGLEDAAKSVAVILRGNAAAFPASGSDQWIDVRPIISGSVGGGSITDHRNLTNLTTGDSGHTQFIMADGTVDLTATWTIATDSITLTAGTLTASTITDGTASISAGAGSGITTLSMNNQLTNSLAIGTAPFVITSTTVVSNLNVDQVDGYDLDQALLVASSPQFAGLTLTGTLALGANKATTTYVPLNAEDLVNKAYADVDLWSKAGTTLSPTTSGDVVSAPDGLLIHDTRATNSPPTFYNDVYTIDFKAKASMTGGAGPSAPAQSGAFGGMLTIAPWSDSSGGECYQLFFLDGGIAYRDAPLDSANWTSVEWQTICESGHSFTMNNGLYIAADIFQARDASGVQLLEDGGKGLSIVDSTGISTFTAPLNIEGTASSTTLGPILGLQFTGDSYKAMELRPYSHDDISISFDAYYNAGAGQWQSSDAGSNFLIQKSSDDLKIQCRNGIAQGSAIAWSDGVTFASSGSAITTTFHTDTITDGTAYFGGDSANFYLDILGSDPRLQMSNDAYMLYNRTSETFAFYATGGSSTLELQAAGVLFLRTATDTLRFDDASDTGGDNATGMITFTVGGNTRTISFDP